MSESHDPWEFARGSQRDEVAAIWANRGAPPPPPPRQRNWARIALIVLGLVAVGALIAFVLLPPLRDDSDRERADAAAAQERLEAAERERLRREGVPVRADGPPPRAQEPATDYRARLVTAGEARITADARERVTKGELDGPVNGTSCRTYPYTETRTAQEADRSIPRNRYQCVAFSRRFDLPEVNGQARRGVIGQPYWLIADYATGALTFCKITPRAGEGGKSLASVPVDPACRDPLA